jgi:hypothetical protein
MHRSTNAHDHTRTGWKPLAGVAALGLAAALVTGCQTPQGVAELQAKNRTLQDELVATRNQVIELNETKDRLNKELAYVQYVNSVLEKEKTIRVGEAEDLRMETRTFISEQMQAVRAFAQQEVLQDYVGSELTARAKVKGENQLLVDLKNRMPANGTLLEGRIYLAEPAPFAFVLAREVADQMIVLWKSDTYVVTNAGLQEITFDIPVSTQAGDCVGAYFPQAVQAPYDNGTGNTRYKKGPVRLGDRFPVGDLKEDKDRTYSFGVAGLFE